ncbi:MAG: DegT/DnrJ/EryC1/StrS family aminotransferase [Pyrinomonadaceae bacterium]
MEIGPKRTPFFDLKETAFRRKRIVKAKERVSVPFMRPELNTAEIAEVIDTLRSGWLTTGPKVKKFENDLGFAVNSKNAIAVNSCTAALHLAVVALGLRVGQAVLVPTMTFAATAEVILYNNAIPILVDCDPVTGNMDLRDARQKIADVRDGKLPWIADPDVEIAGIIPVHIGGFMMDVDEVKRFASEFGLWIVEDAAHAFPSAWRKDFRSPWQYCGENTADVTCYSFYANKTLTTGEGGMAVTDNDILAEKIRLMSLHGLSRDAWKRYSEGGNWDYRIMAPGFKYNLTDIAASIGIHQLERAEIMREQREDIAEIYTDRFGPLEQLKLPPSSEDRIHSWHLYPLRLNLSKMSCTRNEFINELQQSGVGCSVHWRPLHLHPYYAEKLGWREEDLPVATKLWPQLVSLPIFPAMNNAEIGHVLKTVEDLCLSNSKKRLSRIA